MENGQVVNVAIVGLSLRALHHIKNALESITPEDTYIQWSAITHPHLDWLLINEAFIDSPNIQRLLQVKPIKVLKLTKYPVHKDDELISFCFETLEKAPLRRWVMKNIYENKIVEGTASLPTQDVLVTPDIDVKIILQKIVDPANGKIKIFDKTGELATCDLNTQWVWCDSAVKATDHTLNFTHTTMVDILNQTGHQQHYKFWLWNLIWNSPELSDICPNHQYFKLKIWPQPVLNEQHSEILKMSALFAKGATMQDVALRLDLSFGMVQRFVAASMVTGFLYVVERPFDEISHDGQDNPEMITGIKRFFSGIRRRLGL